jgi:nickel-dependent lactate racemase
VQEYSLATEGGRKHFKLPDKWQVLNNVELKSESARKSVYEIISDAINRPIGSAPLAELIKPTQKIAIVIDDLARPTPKKESLSCLFDYLGRYGVTKKQIDVVLATGTHRPMAQAEIQSVFGKKLFREVRFINHDCRSSELISVGRLESAGEVKINPLVVRADFRIGVGSILPHPMCGFGGGAKIIFPGVANYEAIRDHHCALMIAKGASFGNIENNPFYGEICQSGRLAKLDFVINAVYNSNEEVKGVVAGDFEKAQATGVEMTMKELAVHFDKIADVTIASVFPYTEGPQILKPLGQATTITRQGGVVILYANTIKGGRFSEDFLDGFDVAFANSRGDTKRLVLDSLREGKPLIPDAPMDLIGALNLTLLYLSRVKVILVSRDADAKQAARLGFSYVNDFDRAIKMVSKEVPNATVNILPAAGLIVPMVKQNLTFE